MPKPYKQQVRNPTPAEIRERAAEVRSGWSDKRLRDIRDPERVKEDREAVRVWVGR